MVTFIPTDSNVLPVEGNIGSVAMVEIVSSGPVLHIKVAGNLDLMSHSAVALAVDRQVRQYGRVCVLFEIHDRDGCKAIAMWQDKARDFKVQSMEHENLEKAKLLLLKKVACRGDDSRM